MTLLSLKEYASLEQHDTLNPAIWREDGTILPDVEARVKMIMSDFTSFLKINKDNIIDTYITGSNCNYNYSHLSDLDCHLMVRFDPDAKNDTGQSQQDVFNVYRNLYNSSHKLSIHGVPIEVYVAPISEHVTSDAGVYALNAGKWINKPVHGEPVKYDKKSIEAKAAPLRMAIKSLVGGESATPEQIKEVKSKIWNMRAAGLQAGGELDISNLAFKALRNQGWTQKLLDLEVRIADKGLSL